MISKKQNPMTAELVELGANAYSTLLKSKYPKGSISTSMMSLAKFNELPDCSYVRQPIVLSLLSCSKSTLWRLVKSSKVPSPKKISSRISAWNVGQLRLALQKIDEQSS